MNPAIAKIAALALVGVSVLSAEVEMARTVSSRVLAWTTSGQVVAVQHAVGILASTVADEAQALARDAAYDVAIGAVRGASAMYASTMSGIPGGDRLPAVRVETHRVRECGGAVSKPCSIERITVRTRTVESS